MVRPRLYSSRLRWIQRDFPDRGGDGATKIVFLATEVDTVRVSRPRRRGRYFPEQGGDGATKIVFLATRWIRFDFPDQGGEGATFQNEVEMARPILFFSRLRWMQCDFPDRGGDGATKIIFLATEVDTARLSRPRWRRRVQDYIHRD